MKWFLIIAAGFLAMMLVEEVPAQAPEPLIIFPPTGPDIVCIEISPGIWDCQ